MLKDFGGGVTREANGNAAGESSKFKDPIGRLWILVLATIHPITGTQGPSKRPISMPERQAEARRVRLYPRRLVQLSHPSPLAPPHIRLSESPVKRNRSRPETL